MDRFTIIADDLTGACDTGVKFRNAGWETTVVVDAAKSPGLSAVHSPVVAINTGTNLPSVATPNGQAAFLFLLTSSIAPLVRLSYGRMVWMALPYTLVMGGLGWWAVSHWL